MSNNKAKRGFKQQYEPAKDFKGKSKQEKSKQTNSFL
jgi:hypothetical protein